MDLPFKITVRALTKTYRSDWSPGTGWLTGASAGDAVVDGEAPLRRLLRLPGDSNIGSSALEVLRRELGIVVLDASLLHPVTAERRTEDSADSRPPEAV